MAKQNLWIDRAELLVIEAIVTRVWPILEEMDWTEPMELTATLVACHLNGCRLRLRDMLAGDDRDVFHDIGGIARNIDRQTGTLLNDFVPRFAVRH
jgi:hypothetical protein